MAHGSLHRLGGLQHFSNDQLIVVEQTADFGHACHQWTVDDIERWSPFLTFQLKIGNQTVLSALDDVISQTLVQRQVGSLLFLPAGSAAEMCRDGGDMELVHRDLL